MDKYGWVRGGINIDSLDDLPQRTLSGPSTELVGSKGGFEQSLEPEFFPRASSYFNRHGDPGATHGFSNLASCGQGDADPADDTFNDPADQAQPQAPEEGQQQPQEGQQEGEQLLEKVSELIASMAPDGGE